MANFDPNSVHGLIGLWDFIKGAETKDTGLDDGIAQNGSTNDGNGVAPTFEGDRLIVGAGTNDQPTVFDVNAIQGDPSDDDQFNLDHGTLEVQFTQDKQSGDKPDVIVSRGEQYIDEQHEGFFEIRVTEDGKVQAYHNTDKSTAEVTLSTSKGFFKPGDLVNVKYCFDTDSGATLEVENLTTGMTEETSVAIMGLSFDLTDNDDEEFTFGAREKDDGVYDAEFQGAIDYVALYKDPKPANPGPVDGLDDSEFMGPGYTDLQGDQIDGTDGDDDTIFGNDGDDTIDSGEGDDTVDGGSGDDVFEITETGDGIDNDSIVGGETGETDGDRLDLSDIDDDLTVDITAPETGTVTDGTDTTSFEEIEAVETGGGDDTVTGSDGDDDVTTNDGDDEITTGDGSDVVDGGDGDNDIDTSGTGIPLVDDKNGDGFGFASFGTLPPAPADTDEDDDRDLVTTGSGDDTITTGDDADTIFGGSGDNVIDAGIDNDEVTTTFGDDLIVTGEGADTVSSGAGNDTIFGGLDPVFPDELNIPDEGSFPTGGDPDPENGRDSIEAGAGEDLVFGQDDDDTIRGGGGADTLDGGVDDDSIFGDNGQDDLIGGQGADTMFGGADRDEFLIDNREDAFGDIADGGTDGNDVDRLDLRGLGTFEIVNETVDADGDSTSGTVNFVDSDGNVEGTLEFREIENLIPCFTPGALIATPRGEVRVEDLQVGDRVITRDDGIQDIQWIGKKKLSAQDLMADPKLKPVLIKAGSLGNGLPERDMLVSANHRMLIANENTQMLFDEREVLVAAKHLVGQPGVHSVDVLGTEYIHVMFDRHQVILGDGTWTESFQPGDQTLGGFDAEQREEIFKLFPSLASDQGRRAYGAARQSLKAFEARALRETMGAS